MLWALLRELAAGRSVQTPAALAHTLGTTPALVLELAQELTRHGYLSEAAQCAAGCEACTLQAACGPASAGPRLWAVTSKGYRALEQRRGEEA